MTFVCNHIHILNIIACVVFSIGTGFMWSSRSCDFLYSTLQLPSSPSDVKLNSSLSKLNNTCQESTTHNQLCNTSGSHYVPIFAPLWPQSVYYTIKPTLIFMLLTFLPLCAIRSFPRTQCMVAPFFPLKCSGSNFLGLRNILVEVTYRTVWPQLDTSYIVKWDDTLGHSFQGAKSILVSSDSLASFAKWWRYPLLISRTLTSLLN